MKYYSRKFDDGTAYHEIIAFGYFVTVFRNYHAGDPMKNVVSVTSITMPGR